MESKKKCINCGETKALSAFNIGRNQCRVCIKANKKAYCQENKEKRKANKKAYDQENKEKIKDYHQVRNLNLPDSIILQNMNLHLSDLKDNPYLQSIVSFKREHIKLKRLIKELK